MTADPEKKAAGPKDLLEQLAENSLGCSDERVMVMWDKWHKAIREGFRGSKLRDEFESLIDSYGEVAHDARKEIVSLRKRVAELEAAAGDQDIPPGSETMPER